MMGRVADRMDLYIILDKPMDMKTFAAQIRCSPHALQEVIRLEQLSKSWKITEKCHLSIVSLNIRSLPKHYPDVKCDFKMMGKDLICLQETWLTGNEENYALENHTALCASQGRRKGLAAFSKLEIHRHESIVHDNFQVLILLVKDVTVILVYLSQEADLSELLKHLTNYVTNRTVILGDVNFNSRSSNVLTKQLKAWKYSQLVQDPTHDKGTESIIQYFLKVFNNTTDTGKIV